MGLSLTWDNAQEQHVISVQLIEKLEQLMQVAGEQEAIAVGEIALSFVDDEQIHKLNKEFRGIDRPTDVLSFSMLEMGEDELEINYEDEPEAEGMNPLGDIVISVQRAAIQAEEYGHSFEREIGFLFVHGFLHLIGYDHKDNDELESENELEEEMFTIQDRIMQKAGLSR